MWAEPKSGRHQNLQQLLEQGDPAAGSAPSWGGAEGPLTPPRHQISAWVLQQEELDSPHASIIPSTARAPFPVLAGGISSLSWGQEDDGDKG